MATSTLSQPRAPLPSRSFRPQKASLLLRLVDLLASLGDSLHAAREYERLTNAGVHPSVAVRRVFERMK